MALPFKGFLFFTAGHSLTTFELTITRLASKVRKIVKDKIHDEEDSEEDDDGDSEEEDSSDEKWKLRRRRRKRRKRKLLHESSSDYESEESEGPDTISSSSEDESHSKRKLQLLRHFRKTYFNPFWKVELHNRHKLFKNSHSYCKSRKLYSSGKFGIEVRSSQGYIKSHLFDKSSSRPRSFQVFFV